MTFVESQNDPLCVLTVFWTILILAKDQERLFRVQVTEYLRKSIAQIYTFFLTSKFPRSLLGTTWGP